MARTGIFLYVRAKADVRAGRGIIDGTMMKAASLHRLGEHFQVISHKSSNCPKGFEVDSERHRNTNFVLRLHLRLLLRLFPLLSLSVPLLVLPPLLSLPLTYNLPAALIVALTHALIRLLLMLTRNEASENCTQELKTYSTVFAAA
jgi:hypothetical protein